jgi:hypothetical protein
MATGGSKANSDTIKNHTLKKLNYCKAEEKSVTIDRFSWETGNCSETKFTIDFLISYDTTDRAHKPCLGDFYV